MGREILVQCRMATGCWGHCQAVAESHGHRSDWHISAWLLLLLPWRAISSWKNTSAMLSPPSWLIPC